MIKIRSDYVFLNKLNGYMLFWIFIFGCVAGFFVEGLWSIFFDGGWKNHSATVWGPFCVIYGIGGAAVYALAYILRGKSIVIQFAAYMITGSAVEYFGSLFQQLCFGSVSWNYSEHFWNIGGRISLVMTLIWGILGTLFSLFLFPRLQRLFMKLNGKSGYVITWALIVFMTVNLVLSCMAVHRWRERINSNPPRDGIDAFLDEYYDNDKMNKIYSNMEFLL